MFKIKETIIVEGRYDKSTLANYIDAHIIETSGFSIFSDKDKLRLIRRLCEKNGVVILTDSDGAGFVIRHFLKGALPADKVRHAYIPQLPGKERRKRVPGAEGLLGVEGMSREIIMDALKGAGVAFSEEEAPAPTGAGITKAELYADGLSGRADSADRRKRLLERLALPTYLSANELLGALNILCTREEYKNLIDNL